MTLYEITGAARQLYDLLEAGEIDDQTFSDTLEAIGADEKIDAYCKIIRQRKADADALKAEIDRMSEKKRTAENDIDRMKSALIDFMSATGQQKAKTELFSCSISARQSCKITDESAIPADFREPQPDKIKKAEILKALKNGEIISGVEIQTSTSLTIR